MTAGMHLLVSVSVALGCALPVFRLTESTGERLVFAPEESDTTLRSLSVNFSLRDAENLEELFPQASAQCITVEGCGSADGLAAWLESQRDIRELSLICIHLCDADVQAILGLRQLEQLDLRGCVVSGARLELLRSIATLQELDLRGAIVSQE